MVTITQSLTRIQIGIYREANKKWDWYKIKAEEVSEGDSQDSEKLFVCEQAEAESVSFGQCEYSIELKGVLPSFKQFFRSLRERQILNSPYLPSLAIYEYKAGKWVLQSYYRGIIVGDIDRTNSQPFDVKMEALQQVYRNSNNKII